MQLPTWIGITAVAVLVVMVAGLAIFWERDRRSSVAARPPGGPRLPSTRVLALVPAAIFGYLVGAGQWLLAVIAFIAGVVLRLSAERHGRLVRDRTKTSEHSSVHLP